MSEALQTVCPSCVALNRVPNDKPKDKANCGKCQTPLFPLEPVELSAQTFKRTIVKSEFPVLVDFWADWCGPCRQMAPEFAQAAQEMGEELRFAKLDTEAAPEISQMMSIRGIPALILFKDGQEVARKAGVQHHDDIIEWVKGYL